MRLILTYPSGVLVGVGLLLLLVSNGSVTLLAGGFAVLTAGALLFYFATHR
jgi:hypothetical protein